MAQTGSRFFSLMVIGDDPMKIIEKYGADFKVEPYIKYRYLDAKKYHSTAIKTLKQVINNFNSLSIKPNIKETLTKRLENISKLTPFEYYRELTDGLFYDNDGNAISEENPNIKYNTCKKGRNFSLPLILKDGSESYSALVKDIDLEAMNGKSKEIYEAAWEMVMEDRKPQNDIEEQTYNSMKDKTAYFSNFKSKEDYVTYSTSYWNYAYADINGWIDVDDEGDEMKWIKNFYSRFIKNLNPNDLVSIFECSILNN